MNAINEQEVHEGQVATDALNQGANDGNTADITIGAKDQIDQTKVNVEELRVRLKDGEVKFRANTSVEALIAKALEHDIEVPMLEEQAKRGNVVKADYRARYGRSQSNGDDYAKALKEYVTDKDGACNADKLAKVASDNGLTLEKWAHLNIGMQRMNLGNVIRGMAKRGERVQIGEFVLEAQEPDEMSSKIS